MLDNLTMTNEAVIQITALILAPICIFLTFISVCFTLYLKSKWFSFIEKVLEDGRQFYSLSFYFSVIGVLHYATIFLNTFQAKRYGLVEKRDLVPKLVQRLFIINFSIFMAAFFLMLGSIILFYLFR